MIKVIHIVGARPQFVKLAPLYYQMKENQFMQEILHTGQHYDDNMSKNFFSTLNIPEPNYNLSINNLSHGSMTGRMIENIEKVLINKQFDYVVLYGDTNSTLAGAIASKKLGFRIIHVEAGVRNHDKNMPEEINRALTDRISDLLFCSSVISYNNLKNEGYVNIDCKLANVGDLMFETFQKNFNSENTTVSNNILFTCHREDNLRKENLSQIVTAINKLSENYKIIFPAHPSTRNKLKKYKLKCNFKVLEPMPYPKLLGETGKSKFVITDSGGLIKEAYWLKKPSLSIMKNPVWPELIKAKVSFNSYPDSSNILSEFLRLGQVNSFPDNIFGNGSASESIVKIISEDYFEKIKEDVI
tara:strand:+ start:2112 stop:3182 length:1071 start_codon:yes stop_codon:yes gene_type:complete